MPETPPLALLLVAATIALVFPRPGAAGPSPDPNSDHGTACVGVACVRPGFDSGQQAGGFSNSAYRLGQTFTPPLRGFLREVHVGLWSQQPGNAIVEVRRTANGLPTEAIVAEAEVPGSPYDETVLHVADFTSRIVFLEQGVEYALTFRAADEAPVTALASFPPCPVSTGVGNFVTSEDGGQTWSAHPRDRSLIFEVCLHGATPVEAPSWGQLKVVYR